MCAVRTLRRNRVRCGGEFATLHLGEVAPVAVPAARRIGDLPAHRLGCSCRARRWRRSNASTWGIEQLGRIERPGAACHDLGFHRRLKQGRHEFSSSWIV